MWMLNRVHAFKREAPVPLCLRLILSVFLTQTLTDTVPSAWNSDLHKEGAGWDESQSPFLSDISTPNYKWKLCYEVETQDPRPRRAQSALEIPAPPVIVGSSADTSPVCPGLPKGLTDAQLGSGRLGPQSWQRWCWSQSVSGVAAIWIALEHV